MRYLPTPSAVQDELDAPPSPELRVLRWCLVVFLFSFTFDYRSPELTFDSDKTGGSLFQFAFLGLALASSGVALLAGARHLLVRPGVYLILFWWSYLFLLVAVSFLQGNDPARILRLLVAPLLLGLGIAVTHMAACAGMRPGEAVRWFLAISLVSVVWRAVYGIYMERPIEHVRMLMLSPAISLIFAWGACSLLLRRGFTWWTLVVVAVPMAPAVLSITRSLIFPAVTAALASAFCLVLAMSWRLFPASHPAKKLVPITLSGAAAAVACVLALAAVPEMREHWIERLFHNSADGATTEDVSALMRKAEAKSMVDILAREPLNFLWGRGLGASYYWDESYYPELFQVYPEDRHQFGEEIYTAGHSIWTYTLFSGGLIGIGATLAMFFAIMIWSLRAARANARTVMGRWAWDSHLLFLPFVSVLCVLSESITRNPFDERLTGALLGFMAALPQFYFNRAFYLQHREQEAAIAPQILLKEEELPDNWQQAFPARALT